MEDSARARMCPLGTSASSRHCDMIAIAGPASLAGRGKRRRSLKEALEPFHDTGRLRAANLNGPGFVEIAGLRLVVAVDVAGQLLRRRMHREGKGKGDETPRDWGVSAAAQKGRGRRLRDRVAGEAFALSEKARGGGGKMIPRGPRRGADIVFR